jgi:hypothetical protein
MEDNGQSFKSKKLGSSTPSCGPLEITKQQRIAKELSISIPRLGNIWIFIEIELESYFIQFYRPKLDQKLHVGDRLIRIMFSGKSAHLLCLMFSRCLYGKLGWEIVGKIDINFNIRIEDNKIKVVRSKKKKELLEVDDLKQIFLL